MEIKMEPTETQLFFHAERDLTLPYKTENKNFLC